MLHRRKSRQSTIDSRQLENITTTAAVRRKQTQAGVTLVELVVVMVILGVLGTAFIVFFNTSATQYFALHHDTVSTGNLAVQTQRIGAVLRGSTDVTEATSTPVTVYAYFSPHDEYVSLIRY